MFKVSDAVKVRNEELEHHDKAGCVVGFGKGETEGLIEVKLDTEAEPLAFAPADLVNLSQGG